MMKGDTCVSVKDLTAFIHRAAEYGNRRQVKKAIHKGIKVDVQNEEGQTPLFLACIEGHESLVNLLLRHDACPNLRSRNGSTPVHAAAFAGHVKTLEKLIEAGGDLRLHDNEGRSPRDWTLLQDDSKKKRKMIDFIEKSRLFAMSTKGSPEFLRPQKDTSLVGSIKTLSLNHSLRKLNPRSLLETFRQRNQHGNDLHNVRSVGFGKMYVEGNKDHKTTGTVAAVPLIDELSVTHNEQGVTYNNGPFMVMESMHWDKTVVTAKRLHRNCPQGGVVDLLIEEHDYIVKLRHSNILLLMAICQTNNLDGMVLLYEPVAVGSLYHYVHERFETMSPTDVRNIARQIASALLFLHQQNIIHCWVTSHAVQLVSPYTAKLGNFEYAIEQDSDGSKFSFVSQNTYANAAYNWMAPEVMDGNPPSSASDLYSFCVVIWEMLMGEVPWSGMTADTIIVDVLEEGSRLPLEEANIPMPYNLVLEWGLARKPEDRKISMELLIEILETCSMNTNPIEKLWKAGNSQSSLHSYPGLRHGQDIDGLISSSGCDSDVGLPSERSSTRREKRNKRKSAEYLAWYRVHHGGEGTIDEETGLYHDRRGALDELPCSHMRRSGQHLNRVCSLCEHCGSHYVPPITRDESSCPSTKQSPHCTKDTSPRCNCEESSYSHCESCSHCKEHSEHCEDLSDHCDELSEHCEEHSENYESSKPAHDHLHSGNEESRPDSERSSQPEKMSSSSLERSGSQRRRSKRFGSYHKKRSSLTRDEKRSGLSHSHEPSTSHTTASMMNSRFNSSLRCGNLTLQGKNERKGSPLVQESPSIDSSQNSSMIGGSVCDSTDERNSDLEMERCKLERGLSNDSKWTSLPRDKFDESESDASTMTTTTRSSYNYIKDPMKRQFFRQASILISGKSSSNYLPPASRKLSSDSKELSCGEELRLSGLPSHLSPQRESRRNSDPVHFSLGHQSEHISDIYRRHHSTAHGCLANVYGTSGLIQQKPVIDEDGCRQINHREGMGKMRSSYGSVSGFKPATHITEHVVDFKIGPGVGAFEVAKGRLSKEHFAAIKDTVANMDRVVAEIKQSADKFKSEARLSVQYAPEGKSKTNVIGRASRVPNEDVGSDEEEDQWYAGKGCVKNLVDDYEELEEKVLMEASPRHSMKSPDSRVLYHMFSKGRRASEEMETDQRQSMEDVPQMRQQTTMYGRLSSTNSPEQKRRTSTDMGTQTKMNSPSSQQTQLIRPVPFTQSGSDSLLERKMQRWGITTHALIKSTRSYEDDEDERYNNAPIKPWMVTTGSNTDRMTTTGSNTDRMTATSSNTDRMTTTGSNTDRMTATGSNTDRMTTTGSNTDRMTNTGSNTDRSSLQNEYLMMERINRGRERGEEIDEFIESVTETAAEETRSSLENFYSASSLTERSNPSVDDLQGESIECHYGSFETDEQTRPMPSGGQTESKQEKRKTEVTFSNVVLEKAYSDGTASSAGDISNASPEFSASAETIEEQQNEECENVKSSLEIEDLYFDDEINQSMYKDKNMRLQTTMSLDTSLSQGHPIQFDDAAGMEKSQGDFETVVNTPLPTLMPSEKKKRLLACSTPNQMIPHMVEISEIQDSSGNSDGLSKDVDLSANDESLPEEEDACKQVVRL